LAGLATAPATQVDQRHLSGPPYSLAIFPWMLQNEANFYLQHALARIIYDIKTGKLFSARNRTAISLYHGEFNNTLDCLLSKVVSRYLEQKTG
jgi:hypothetical protein